MASDEVHANPATHSPSVERLLEEASVQGLQELGQYRTQLSGAFQHLFGPIDPRVLDGILGRYARQAKWNAMPRRLLDEGRLDELMDRVEVEGLEPLQSHIAEGVGATVVFAHVGPPAILPVVLARAGLPTVMIRNTRDWAMDVEGLELWDMPAGDGVLASLFLKRAIDTLKRGAVVLMAMDGQVGAHHQPCSCLGREVRIPQGPFILQRLTGAPIILARTDWTEGGRVRVRLGAEAGAGVAGPPRTPRELAHWMEALLRDDPSQLRTSKLQLLLEAPRAPSASPRVHRISESGFPGSH